MPHEIHGLGYEVLRCAEDGSGSEVQPECLDDPSGGNTTMNVIEPPSSTQPNSGTLITPLINSDEKFTPYSDHSLVKEEGVEVDLNEATSTPRQQRNTWWLIWRKVPTESTKRNGKQGGNLRLISHILQKCTIQFYKGVGMLP